MSLSSPTTPMAPPTTESLAHMPRIGASDPGTGTHCAASEPYPPTLRLAEGTEPRIGGLPNLTPLAIAGSPPMPARRPTPCTNRIAGTPMLGPSVPPTVRRCSATKAGRFGVRLNRRGAALRCGPSSVVEFPTRETQPIQTPRSHWGFSAIWPGREPRRNGVCATSVAHQFAIEPLRDGPRCRHRHQGRGLQRRPARS